MLGSDVRNRRGLIRRWPNRRRGGLVRGMSRGYGCSPAGLAAVVVVWTGVRVHHPRVGSALLGLIAALPLAHSWAARRASTTVWWACAVILLALAGIAGYAWVRIGFPPTNPRLVAVLVSIFPLAACSALGLGYLWRLCERLLADHRHL